ncbi:RNA ligase family protein [Amycolatopsis sp. WAC 01375]|uniref:RNA ligase family protein n=1 Tax=Amycolatopsis sp. WAC 01375 TaxID=2203194 RepID=UPI001F332DA8|nr:RNA ligase family protein [Amycolatopsis sp. WAC 01375]
MEQARGRGRPRKDPAALARWTPPEGWSRLVAWISPEEKKALKHVAVEADVPVAELIRALAGGLAVGAITPEELIGQVVKGKTVMEKIPTLFERDERFHVVDRPRAECAWVFEGAGVGTEKLDGTNVRLTVRAGQVVRVEKRRNPSKAQKQQGIVDGWYVDTDSESADDKWILAAAGNTNVSAWPDGEHPSEALGPRIQGNPLGLEEHRCVPFDFQAPALPEVPRSYHELRDFLATLDSRFSPGHTAEGVVFHHPDGRRAKIKRKDFPRTANA